MSERNIHRTKKAYVSNYEIDHPGEFLQDERRTSFRLKSLPTAGSKSIWYDKEEAKKCKAGGRTLDKSEHTKYQHYLNRTPFISPWLRDHKDLLDPNEEDSRIILDQINQEDKNNG